MSNTPARPIIGTSTPIFVPLDPAPSVSEIRKGEGYFLVRIRAAQASYKGVFWTNMINPPRQAIITSQVQIHPGIEQPVEHLQVARRMRANQAVQLGLRSNLIDWVPANMDSLKLTFTLLLDRKDRLAALSQAINGSSFLSPLSLSEPALATAKVLGNVSRQVLDALLEPEAKTPILEFKGDFNVGTDDLRAGYYVLLGTTDGGSPLPSPDAKYEVNGASLLIDDKPAEQWSYVILQVLCTKARDRNPRARWDGLLREAESVAEALGREDQANVKERRNEVLDRCRALIAEAEALLRADPNYLATEAKKIIEIVFERCRKTIVVAEAARLGAAAARVGDDWAAETRVHLNLPGEEQMRQESREYAAQLRDARAVSERYEETDRLAEEVRRQVEELDACEEGTE